MTGVGHPQSQSVRVRERNSFDSYPGEHLRGVSDPNLPDPEIDPTTVQPIVTSVIAVDDLTDLAVVHTLGSAFVTVE
jgi:hypothetical protein